MVEVESAISIIVERASGPRLTDLRTVIFELRFLPYVWARPDGNPRRPDGRSNLPLNWTWKESEADRSLRGVRTGCWDVRTDASWNSSFSKQWRSRRKMYVVRMDDAWAVKRLDGMSRHVVQTDGTVGRWASGRDGSIVQTADREPKIFWLAGRIFWHHSE
jgi:hypothetical protein